MSFHTYRCDSAYCDVYAARMDGAGNLLDAGGFPVCTAEGDQENTAVAFGGGTFMVLWEDERNFDVSGYDVYGSRVAPDGTIVDTLGIRINHLNLWERSPHVVGGSESFVTVWEWGKYDKNWDVAGCRINSTGEVVDSVPLVASTACDAQLLSSSAWSGQSYLAIWEEGEDLYCRRVDRFGTPMDPGEIEVCSATSEQREPDLDWSSGSYLAVWEDARNSTSDIYAGRIDSAGEILDPSGLSIGTDPATDQIRPAIASDGANHLVVWQTMLDSTGANYKIEGALVSSEGQPLNPLPISISPGDKGSHPDVAFGSGKYLVVWTDASFYDIYGAVVETSGVVGSPIGIRLANGIQQNPSVASDGSSFMVAWEDFSTHWPDADILAARVTSDGVVLDPYGIYVAATQDAEELPSIAYDGTNYVLTWRTSSSGEAEVRAGRVTPDGMVLEPGGFFISEVSPYSATSICFGPLSNHPYQPRGQCLLLFSRYQTEPYNSPRLFGAFLWGDTEPNFAPEPFSLLFPEDQDSVSAPVLLDWEDAFDSNPTDFVTYTAYLGPSEGSPPESTLVISDLASSQCKVWPEWSGLSYWWRVKAQDSWGETRWSDQSLRFVLQEFGDVDGDGSINLEDVVYLLNHVLKNGPPPEPLSAGDTNGDCDVDLSDIIYLLNYLFKGGPGPVAGCA